MKSEDLIVTVNIGITFLITGTFHAFAYFSDEAYGIGFIYFSFLAILINIGMLLVLSAFSYLTGFKNSAKGFIRSVFYCITVYVLLTIILYIIT